VTASRVELAALNNALWCDAVCRAHGVPGEVGPTVWLNVKVPPPYHPNLIVISSMTTQTEIDEHVRHLCACSLSATWSLKDSFFNLDMVPHGFGVLFEAAWMWLDADRVAGQPAADAVRCERITTASELATWEACWRDDAANDPASGQPRQFPDALLRDRKIAFLACVEDGRISAVGIAHRTSGVIGLSNVVIHTPDRRAAWASLIGLTGRLFPGFPVVGYERENDLQHAVAAGFRTIGPLRVWNRQPGYFGSAA
jgi:hypothetical protein